MKQETIYDRIETSAYEKWKAILLLKDMVAMAEPKTDFQRDQIAKAKAFIMEME